MLFGHMYNSKSTNVVVTIIYFCLMLLYIFIIFGGMEMFRSKTEKTDIGHTQKKEISMLQDIIEDKCKIISLLERKIKILENTIDDKRKLESLMPSKKTEILDSSKPDTNKLE